jgi:hypothetical protein
MAVISSMQQTNELVQELVDKSNGVHYEQMLSPTRKRKLSCTQSTPCQQQSLLDDFQSPTDTIATPDIPKRQSLSKLIGDDLQSLFYAWFKDDQISTFQVSDRQEKCVMKKISKMVIYLKLFLPATCTLLCSRPDRIDAYQEWLVELRRTSTQVQESTMKFLATACQQLDPASKPLSRCIMNRAAIWATEKLLDKIPMRLFPRCQVQDLITQTSTNIYNSNDIAVFRA